jgi:hypothetical protein
MIASSRERLIHEHADHRLTCAQPPIELNSYESRLQEFQGDVLRRTVSTVGLG